MPDGYHHLTTLDESSADAKFAWAPEMTEAVAGEGTTQSFDGRPYPLAYFGEGSDEQWDVSFIIDTGRDGDMWAELQSMLVGTYRSQPLLWTDTFGNIRTVMVNRATWSPIPSGDKTLARVAFHMTRIEDAADSPS